MLQSMTGYGKSVCDLGTKKIYMELKSLNSKQLDLNIKLPGRYKEKELEMRNEIIKQLNRGKIELFMNYELIVAENNAVVNKEIVKDYFLQLSTVAKELGIDFSSDVMPVIMRLPDSLKIDKQELDEKEWKQILSALHAAIDDLISFRSQEGESLQKDIIKHTNKISTHLEQLSKYETQRLEKIKSRILCNLKEIFEDKSYDENRFEQEMIYYIEKLDITEEKIRLKNHCKFFLETMEKEDFPGKKLGFIAQEIGREINTIGSKANDFDIQQIVVQMKDELEKIKEQLLNIL